MVGVTGARSRANQFSQRAGGGAWGARYPTLLATGPAREVVTGAEASRENRKSPPPFGNCFGGESPPPSSPPRSLTTVTGCDVIPVGIDAAGGLWRVKRVYLNPFTATLLFPLYATSSGERKLELLQHVLLWWFYRDSLYPPLVLFTPETSLVCPASPLTRAKAICSVKRVKYLITTNHIYVDWFAGFVFSSTCFVGLSNLKQDQSLDHNIKQNILR